MSTVLVVEDEREIRELLRRYLERAGHAVLTHGVRCRGAAAGRGGRPGPGGARPRPARPRRHGRAPRGAPGRTPYPRSSCSPRRAGVDDRIAGLSLGADDYVTKPFSPTEVVLRVAAVLGRSGDGPGAEVSSYGGGRLVLDAWRREARVGDRPVDLTPTEWGDPDVAGLRPGPAFSRYELVNRVRGYEYAGYERSIDSHVKNLRQKLGPTPWTSCRR